MYPSFPYTCNFLSGGTLSGQLQFTYGAFSAALPGALVIGSVLEPFWEVPDRKEEKLKIKIPPPSAQSPLLPQAALVFLCISVHFPSSFIALISKIHCETNAQGRLGSTWADMSEMEARADLPEVSECFGSFWSAVWIEKQLKTIQRMNNSIDGHVIVLDALI